MFSGEYDVSSIDFNSYPIISQIMFAVFVFIVTIVLLNLMNGLAISDIQALRADAELLVIQTRIEMLSLLECIFFGVKQKVAKNDMQEFDHLDKIEDRIVILAPKFFQIKSPVFYCMSKQISMFPLEFSDFRECKVNVAIKPAHLTTLKNGEFPPEVVKMDQNLVNMAQLKINEKSEAERYLKLKKDDELKRKKLEEMNESTLKSLKRIEENIFEFLNKHEKFEKVFRTIVETKFINIEMETIENNFFKPHDYVKTRPMGYLSTGRRSTGQRRIKPRKSPSSRHHMT